MQAAVAAMKPQLVDDAVTAWANIGGALMGTFVGFNQQFARTVTGADGHSGWTGAAASAAVAAVNNYAQQSLPLSQAATAISLKLNEMRTGIEQTQALMPGLTERANVTGKSLPADGVMKVDDHNRDEATQEGRRILRTVYAQVAGQTDNGVPFLPTAPTITSGDGNQGVNGETNSGGTQGGSTDGGTSTGDQSADTPGDGTTEDPGTETPSTTPTSTDPGSTTPQSTTPQSTTPTAATPTATAPTSPGSATPGTGSPGVGSPVVGTPGGSGRGASGQGGSGTPRGTGAPGSATPGKAVPGSQSPAAAAAGTRSGTATSGAGRGVAGMGGMGAPGARGGSDDERTKGIPDYLITQENGDLLLGTNEIRTVPPVIGGDDDSAPS
ncbi:hypothetical protein [Nocardia sp. NPDC058705]|uniref:hypothetical protein n=1 Tax=Nocardia sp. NPDC058705 TaxID=3346609 RepID=UPI0036C816BD